MKHSLTRRLIGLLVMAVLASLVVGFFMTAIRRDSLRRGLADAVHRSDAAGVRVLLARGADPNLRDFAAPERPWYVAFFLP